MAVLAAGTHADLKFNQAQTFEFAADLNAIIVAATEFAEAALSYPIVFSENNASWSSHVITGHSAGENLFLDDEGKWRQGAYIPAYVRRYPFILVEDRERDQLTLAADTKSAMFGTDAGAPLFEDGKPSEVAINAFDFCTAYHNQLRETEKLLGQIAEADLMIARNADVTLPEGGKRRITGFHVVDEAKLTALDDGTFLALRKSGALNLVYTHLISMRNWRNIVAGQV